MKNGGSLAGVADEGNRLLWLLDGGSLEGGLESGLEDRLGWNSSGEVWSWDVGRSLRDLGD